MSTPQYETYGQAPFAPHEPYGGGAAAVGHGGYEDPYRPAYEMAPGAGEYGAYAVGGDGSAPGGPEYGGYAEHVEYAGAVDAPALAEPAQDADADVDAAPLLPRQAEGPRSAGRARARRAARRKRGGERPDGLRRLVPQALVVAFLAGGTSAFVANDKAIQLSVDGKSRTLHTFADDVGELLADEGVDVGTHDIVAPTAGTVLASGDEIAVRYGRPVRLTLDGKSRQVWTTARTVDGALRQLGVRAEGAYLSASRSKRIAREGLELDVRTERTVTVMADGRARTLRTNAATVHEAVEESGVTLRGSDTTSAPPDSFPRDGQTITVMRISGRKEVREEVIPFEVRKTEDASLLRGTEAVVQAGHTGARRVTYALRTVNGVKQKPRRIKSEVVREPQTRIVKVGTKAPPTSVPGADGLDWGALATCESGGRPNAVDPSGTYGGLYQFDTRTWQGLGGSGRPQDAPAAEQTHRAKKLYVQRGASPWPHCGKRL
ncbi:resuscitation-promoting factor [Streptomyces sp. AN091965]|uniref:resuscitation-promoting factor n=1 Tax=Streptomyces sp. AN091965 TaxID=2927803 RepID=UPI001F60BCA1|nr:resuscitation-promoting factor [Streptomyces sp. AN091965]MCI3931218.1 ubiquitin-like domain-containing protein [Streptomyces sp. AN091965]